MPDMPGFKSRQATCHPLELSVYRAYRTFRDKCLTAGQRGPGGRFAEETGVRAAGLLLYLRHFTLLLRRPV